MAKIIHLYNEVSNISTKYTVTNKDYKILESLQYSGGFKRFGLSMYDEITGVKPKDSKVIDFLNEVFNNKPHTVKYFDWQRL